MTASISSSRKNNRTSISTFAALAIVCTLLFAPAAGAQETSNQENQETADPQPAVQEEDQPSPQEPATGAASKDPQKDQPPALPAVVIEVMGTVEWAVVGVSPLASEGWTAVKLNDQLLPGSQIRTGLRAHVNLRFGESTIISVRGATHAGIDQFYRSATTETVRIGLAYGSVRGGSTEGEVRSDVVVDSPIATLGKRGTEGWELQVEAGTGRFRVSLAKHGLVEAIQRISASRSISRTVQPGEYATQDNIANMWIKQDIFDRNVTLYETSAISEADSDFAAANTRGYAALSPGGGTSLMDLSKRVDAGFVLDQLAANAPPDVAPPNLTVISPSSVRRPEGNFGTGGIFRILVPAPSPRSVRK